MANFKNKLENYQCIPRELILDNRLSDRARFLFVYMASKPSDWNFYMNPMAKELGYSTETLRKYINELIASGWLIKGEQNVSNSGTFGSVEYTLMDRLDSNENIRNGILPIRKKPDKVKNRIGKNHTLKERDYLQKDITTTETEKEENSAVAFEYPNIEFDEVKTKPQIKTDYHLPTTLAPIISIETFEKEYLTDNSAIESLCMLYKLPIENIKPALKEFKMVCKAGGKDENKTNAQFKSHFSNWVRVKIQKSN